MATRDVTVTFDDGTSNIYKNTPEDITPQAIQTRAEKDFSKKVTGIDGGRKPSEIPVERRTVMQDVLNLPPEDATTGEKIMGSLSARTAMGLVSPFVGAFQLGANAGDWIAKQMGVTPVVGQAVADVIAKAEAMKRRGMGPGAWDVAGTVGSLVTGGAALKGLATATTLPGKVAQGMTAGGVFGATTPSETPGLAPQLNQAVIGATLGGGLPAAVPVVKKIGELGYNLVSPLIAPVAVKGNALLKAAGDKAQEVVNALRGTQQTVPGYQQTAGEAATPANSSGFSALAKEIENASVASKDAAIKQRDAANAARIAQLQTVGGTPQELAAAKAIRESTASTLYPAANKEIITADATLNTLLERPSMEKALARAAKIAEEKNKPFQIGANAPAQQVPSAIIGANGAPAGITNIPAEFAKYPGESLHFLKQGLDDLIKNPERFGIGQTEVNAIKDTRGAYMTWLKTNAPKYEAAREAYRAESIPINQMQLGQYLESKLKPALGEEGKQRVNVFTQAIANAPATITKAITGAPRYQELANVLNPNQLAAVNSVLKDLERGARFEDLALQGAKVGDTGLKMASEAIGTIPHILDPKVTIINAILNRVKGGMNPKLAEQLAETMLDPKLTADAMEKALARQASIKANLSAAAKLQPLVGVAAAQSKLNKLAPDNQNNLAR